MTKSIYLALDFSSWNEASSFLAKYDLQGIPVKVGMELYYREGPALIEKLKNNGHPIFLDLKLHDIPTTVMRTMKVLASLEVDMVNVHALGGSDMIKYAKEGLLQGNSLSNTLLIAVTVLTSMDNQQLRDELKITGDVSTTVTHLATLSKESGADGVVCSVQEVRQIKQICGGAFRTVTPGIRLLNSDLNDQKRVSSPEFARHQGADYLVIGRSVTQAANPSVAYKQALTEWGK